MADESWLSSVRPSLGIKRWCLGNIGLSSHQGGWGCVVEEYYTRGGGEMWKTLLVLLCWAFFQFYCTGLPGLLG